MPGVLITRPEPGAAETAAAVTALGWKPVLAPALVLAPCGITPVQVQASLITSRAAAAALPLGPPVLAVGEASAQAARALGHQALAASGDAAGLLALAKARLNPTDGPLLLAVGQGYAQDLAEGLRAAGFRVLRRVAYVARPADAPPAEAVQALAAGRIRAGLFFSPRSAALAMPHLAAAAPAIRAIAISPRVAHTLRRLPWASISIAAQPDHAAMLGALGRAIDH